MTLPWKTKSDKSIPIMEDRTSELLYYYHMNVLQEGGYHERQAFRLDFDKKYHCGNVFSRQVDLAYDRYLEW